MEKSVAVDELQAAVQRGELDVILDGGVTYLVRNERYAHRPPDGPSRKTNAARTIRIRPSNWPGSGA